MIFGCEVSSAQGVKCYLKSLHKPPNTGGSLIRIHDCAQNTMQCKASASGLYSNDSRTGKLHQNNLNGALWWSGQFAFIHGWGGWGEITTGLIEAA